MRNIALSVVFVILLACPLRAETSAATPGIAGLLDRTMRGQPVVAVNATVDAAPLPDVRFRQGDSLKTRLQTVGEAAGFATIPYAWRGAWVMAPATRKVLDLDISRGEALSRYTRSQLVRWTLYTLPSDVLPLLGVRDGVSIARLPEEPRVYLQAALRAPMTLYRVGRKKVRPHVWDGIFSQTGRIDEPLDWSRVRLRAHLRSATIASTDRRSPMRRNIDRETSDIFVYGAEGSTGSEGVRDPDLLDAPNRLKPSDLDVLPFTKPIGFRGVCTVDELTQRAAKVTGLRLTVAPAYRDRLAFVGLETMACRDVLDGLRLALCATWRRLGGAYCLVWERQGVGGLELAAAEALMDLRADTVRANDKGLFDERWWDFLKRVPFADGDPLALTMAQRAEVFSDPPSDVEAARLTEVNGPPCIPYDRLTPAQQAAVRAAMDDPSDAPSAESRQMGLDGCVGIVLEVYLPGYGWVNVPMDSCGDIYGNMIYTQLARKVWLPSVLNDGSPPEKEVIPLGKERAVMVPALNPERVDAVADQMKRRGFTTLYYPALIDGYATFPSKAFPLHPALKGEDGWARMERTMGAKGIRVVGYLNTLAWRSPDARAHWLDAHPDWLDRDVLGRSRRTWSAAHPEFPWEPMGDGLPFTGDTVRPAEPQVVARLETLLGELAKRKPVGVAFAQWRPSGWNPSTRGIAPPPLGFALPDRIAAFEATAHDPADDPLPLMSLRILGVEETAGLRPYAQTPEPSIASYVTLLKRLLDRAAQLRPDWLTVVIDDAGGPRFTMDVVDIRKPPHSVKSGLLISPSMVTDATVGLLHPLWSADPARQPAWVRKAAPNPGPALLYYARYFGSIPTEQRPVSLLDFRLAPDDISATLALVDPPANPPAAK
ncbi:MAG TPA: hypothetical protein VGM37_01975 [Armatimonadota bacterium]|jgi:hypothetical protein